MIKSIGGLLVPITKWNLNIFMLVAVEKAIYQAQSLKKKLFSNKNKNFSFIESE